MDPILNKIESGWKTACQLKFYKKAAKWLRIFVQYTKVQGGIPEKHQARAHEMIDFLVDNLDNVDDKSASDVVTAIKTARNQLRAKIEYGSGFKATLTDAERERASRIGKPVTLSFQNPEREIAPADNAGDAIFDNYLGIDGTELD
jgi:hypothetical protein